MKLLNIVISVIVHLVDWQAQVCMFDIWSECWQLLMIYYNNFANSQVSYNYQTKLVDKVCYLY